MHLFYAISSVFYVICFIAIINPSLFQKYNVKKYWQKPLHVVFNDVNTQRYIYDSEYESTDDDNENNIQSSNDNSALLKENDANNANSTLTRRNTKHTPHMQYTTNAKDIMNNIQQELEHENDLSTQQKLSFISDLDID